MINKSDVLTLAARRSAGTQGCLTVHARSQRQRNRTTAFALSALTRWAGRSARQRLASHRISLLRHASPLVSTDSYHRLIDSPLTLRLDLCTSLALVGPDGAISSVEANDLSPYVIANHAYRRCIRCHAKSDTRLNLLTGENGNGTSESI